MRRPTRQDFGVSKRQRQRARSSSKPIATFIVAMSLAAVGVLAWMGWHSSRQQQNSANGALTNTSALNSATNKDDAAMFRAWLSTNVDATELLGVGTKLLEEGRPDAAILCYRRAHELKPTDEEACFNLGVAHARLGQAADAERYYREALKLFPDYVEAHINLGNLLTRQKRYDEALTEFNAALKLSPEDASAHNNLGRVLAQRGEPVEAVKHFAEAARLDTNYVEARFNLGTAHLTLGQTNDAIAAFQEVLRLRPNFGPAMQALARLKTSP